jgi:Type I phosphodiesterase / nucleotide pyrophosphatase
VVIDGMPDRHVHHERTPHLWGLGRGDRTGAFGRGRGLACMTSATYPNHATFVTGVDPDVHGIVANRLFAPEHGLLNSWVVGPTAPTIFDQFSNRYTEAVFGDHHLIGAMGARAATRHWPLDGVRPDGVAYDDYGYTDDDVTIDVLCEAIERRPDVVVAQLNSPDTFGHVYGPDSPEALENHRRVDGLVGRLVSSLDWNNSVLVVVSDHDQELVTRHPPIDLVAEGERLGCELRLINEGSAAIVRGWPTDGPSVNDINGVHDSMAIEGATSVGDVMVWSEPGRWFGRPSSHVTVGVHGGQRTRAQLAIVAGGHPSAAALADAIDQRTVPAREWLGLITNHVLGTSKT